MSEPTPVAPSAPDAAPKVEPPAAPPAPKLTFGQAVKGGFRQAGAPVAGVLDLIGGHLILVGRALAWLP
ncbi:MAG: hypothetical protein NT062_15360, partial [Proteobacteria bacterium]|nr:hypothetical protein [Pseudomonadota bacterium]